MLSRSAVIFVIPAILVTAGVAGGMVYSTIAVDSIEHCVTASEHEAGMIDCWFEVIRQDFMSEGTQAAFDTFEYIYREYDTFANTGCHRHAHRVGDMSYYFDYLTHKDLARMEFPANANACGYGFYHGFFEHLVQDNPEPEFVTKTCDTLEAQLVATAPAIRQTCYHGSGHGFVLSQADHLLDSADWNIRALIDKPLALCEALPKASDYERSECRQGVFNVLVDWMADEEYGLAYDYEHPFRICDAERHDRQSDCYYEMAQKVDAIAGFDPVRVVEIAQSAAREDLQKVVIGVAVAGMVQHDPKDSQDRLLAACQLVDGELGDQCLKSIVGGLIEHETEQSDYQTAFAFCGQSGLVDEERAVCYSGLNDNIRRYRSEEDLQARCAEGLFPPAFCALVPSTS